MSLKDDKIKDLFSSKLNGFEPEVPASVWSGLDQVLSQPEASPKADNEISVAKKSTLKHTLIAVGLAASVAVGIYNLPLNQEQEVGGPAIVEGTNKNSFKPTENSNNSLIEDVLLKSQSTPRRTLAIINTKKGEVVEPKELKEPSISKLLDARMASPEASSAAEMHGIDEELAESPLPFLPKFLREDIVLAMDANAGVLASDVNSQPGNILFSRDVRSAEFIDVLNNQKDEYELNHRLPVSVGLTVAKKLSKDFSVETGLVFTYLSSDIKSNQAVNLKEKQTFGYLGVPLYVNYSFYRMKKADFYISLGAVIQKDIFGRYTSNLNVMRSQLDAVGMDEFVRQVIYAEPTSIKENISQSHWQLSSHVGVGASYPIYRQLRIYTTVGGAYYFDAHNEYRTIFSDRKFQLDLNLGLKVDF